MNCTKQNMSYVILNKAYPAIYGHQSFLKGDLVQIDLFFSGTWSNEILMIQLGQFIQNISYTNPTNYAIQIEFCDDQKADVMTINFTITKDAYWLNFTSFNNQNGSVAIRNVIQTRLKCYPSCKTCTGQEYNQCTGCFYGLPVNNICPPCPSDQCLKKNQNCDQNCDYLIGKKTYDGFYQQFTCKYFAYLKDYSYLIDPNQQYQNWYQIYDYTHVNFDQAQKKIYSITYKHNSGVSVYYNLNLLSQDFFFVGIYIDFYLGYNMPIGCGIQFYVNNSYYGSIYKTIDGYQYHNVKLFKSDSNYINLQMLIDAPKQDFKFTVIGNYNDSEAGWKVNNIYFSSGLCPRNCRICDVSYKCKVCYQYVQKDGTCSSCNDYHEKINGSYCFDIQKEIPCNDNSQISNFLVRQEKGFNPIYYQQFQLINQNGSNFLKGKDIFYQYDGKLGDFVFGGKFIWAQAKFQQVYNIKEPHHSLTIGFFIQLGPQFPTNGLFIYTFDQSQTYNVSNSQVNSSIKIEKTIAHNYEQFSISFECLGPDNEPIKAYCGVYGYYIIVHNCQPYCLNCADQLNCTTWNSTDHPKLIMKEDCQSTQYYDQDQFLCLPCPSTCLTCISEFDCSSCKSNYTLQKYRCICQRNEYEEEEKCLKCPDNCKQCLNPQHCLECSSIDNRQLLNKQCICYDGYYSVDDNPKCLKCNILCKTCYGPEYNQCIKCNDIDKMQIINNLCQCLWGTYYSLKENACLNCHSTCETCNRATSEGCLSCKSDQNRILRGLSCICKTGYYEEDQSCKECPPEEDEEFSQCYKQCKENQYIWHTSNCTDCDIGFDLIDQECQPKCGDLQVKGYEKCDNGETKLNDLCFNCQYQCPIHCTTCNQQTLLPCPDVCGDGIITGTEECDDGNNTKYDGCYNCQYQCQDICIKCIKGLCYDCKQGWEIDPNTKPWVCKEVCGDNLIVGLEKCDPGSQRLDSPNIYGCKECQFYCEHGCTKCNQINGKCEMCQEPGLKAEKFYCYSTCGDGIIVKDTYFNEQCDYGTITDRYHGCNSSCQFQCQDEKICQICKNNQCQVCAPGYDLIIPSLECQDKTDIQCVQDLNHNNSQYCRPQCKSQCLICSNSISRKGTCYRCKEGYQYVMGRCLPICGDKIVTEDEECDDGNFIYNDGCHQCLLTCEDSCTNCIQGQCYFYKEESLFQMINFIINLGLHNQQTPLSIQNQKITIEKAFLSIKKGYQYVMGRYLPICGDKIITEDEECDDGNFIYNDGCHQCFFTCHIGCSNCIQGQCYDYQKESQSQINNFMNNQDLSDIQKSLLSLNDDQNIQGSCLVINKGQQSVNGKCLPICNDEIIVEDEQCDDGNLQYGDGCHQCLFSCDDDCSNCVKGTCYKCYEGFYFFEVQNKIKCIKQQDQKTVFKQQNVISIFILNHLKITRFQNNTIDFPIELSSQELNISKINQQTKQSFYFINETMSTIYFKIECKCWGNKTIFSKFINYKNGSYNKKINLSHQCGSENSQNVISYEIGIKRELLSKEKLILSILIEDELCAISSVVQKEYQRILLISFNNYI